MAQGYTRNDSANNIADANIIDAVDLHGEFDALVAAFTAVTGHAHDGTAANGATIGVLGPNQDIVITSDRFRPKTDNTVDLGTSSLEFKDLYIDGVANIDSLVADTADINAGTIDGVTIATSDITVGTGKTLNVSAGTLTLADNQISGDKVEGGTINAITVNTLASTTIDTTNLEVTNLKAKDGTSAGSIADTTGLVTLNTVDINGGTVDGTTVGATTASTVRGTTITATTGFTGNLTGSVTGNVTGNLTGNVTGDLTGDVTATSLTVAGTAITAEMLGIFDGLTATVVELNILDGATLSTAELNILDGVTSSTADLNKLDNVAGDVVGTSDTQTLTNKTITSPSVVGTILEDVYVISGTSVALDPDNGSIQTHTLTANTTYTDSLSSGEAITLMIDDGSARTITWPTITWANNARFAPNLALTGYTVVAVWKVSTTLYGALVGDGT
jgi:hypothetical protein